MEDLEILNAETLIDSKELKELVARLNDPNHPLRSGKVQIKDVAETFDLSEAEVIQELARLRSNKKTQPVPEEAEKLAVALDELKTKGFKPVTHRSTKRIVTVSILMIIGIIFSIYMMLIYAIPLNPSSPKPFKHERKQP